MHGALGYGGWTTLALAIGASTAAATPLPTFYNGRALGMGGSALAYTDDATATAINPANLASVDEWSGTVAFSPFMPASKAPFAPGGESDGNRLFVPLMFLGAGVRVTDDLVAGLAVYAESGAGANYTAVPELGGMSAAFEIGVLEAIVPLSYQISDEVSVGAGLRMGFATMSADMPVDPGTGPMRFEQSINGVGFPGVAAGVQYAPLSQLSFAAVYRSKLTMNLSGDGTATIPAMGGQGLEIESEWSTPHTFVLGAAYAPLPRQLMIATDVRYSLLDEAVDDVTMAIDMVEGPGPSFETSIPLQWQNSVSWMTGIEYRASTWLPLRLGYGLTTSATPQDHAAALVPPPGIIHSFHLGAGIDVDELAVDLGGAYGLGSSDVDTSINGPSGTYSSDYFLVALSATYRPSASAAKTGNAYSMLR
jgi:long-chain fatty acid transport protein